MSVICSFQKLRAVHLGDSTTPNLRKFSAVSHIGNAEPTPLRRSAAQPQRCLKLHAVAVSTKEAATPAKPAVKGEALLTPEVCSDLYRYDLDSRGKPGMRFSGNEL
jgi:hypothetical protein